MHHKRQGKLSARMITLSMLMMGTALSTAAKPSPHSGPTLAGSADKINRLCWYQGLSYSHGAPLKTPAQQLYCLPQDPDDDDGPLVWRAVLPQERESRIYLRGPLG